MKKYFPIFMLILLFATPAIAQEDYQYLVMAGSALDIQERIANIDLGYIVVIAGVDTFPFATKAAFGRIHHPSTNIEALVVSDMAGMIGATVCNGRKCSVIECVNDIFNAQKPLQTYLEMEAAGWFDYPDEE